LPRKLWADLQTVLDSSDDDSTHVNYSASRQWLEQEVKRLKHKYYVAKGKALA